MATTLTDNDKKKIDTPLIQDLGKAVDDDEGTGMCVCVCVCVYETGGVHIRGKIFMSPFLKLIKTCTHTHTLHTHTQKA